MKTRTIWSEKMKFTGECDGNVVQLDAKSPIGEGKGLTPKELLAIGVAGCSAMDVVALMKKHKQPIESFEVVSDVTPSEGVQPAVFKNIILSFILRGHLDKSRVVEAVQLSQTRYCGVSAMLFKTVPIQYRVILNDEEIASGFASFS
jgi:putative redox protein